MNNKLVLLDYNDNRIYDAHLPEIVYSIIPSGFTWVCSFIVYETHSY